MRSVSVPAATMSNTAAAYSRYFARCGHVGEHRRPGDKGRAHPAQPLDVQRRGKAARLAEGDQVAQRRQAVQAPVEGVFAHRIVGDVHAPAAGDALDLFQEVLLGVEDHLVGAGRARQRRLLLGGRRPDHERAGLLGDLAQEQADAAGCGMHQAPIAGLQRIGDVRQDVGGDALHHGRGALLEADRSGQGRQPVGRHQCVRRHSRRTPPIHRPPGRPAWPQSRLRRPPPPHPRPRRRGWRAAGSCTSPDAGRCR